MKQNFFYFVISNIRMVLHPFLKASQIKYYRRLPVWYYRGEKVQKYEVNKRERKEIIVFE
jgi:hypothetical protein